MRRRLVDHPEPPTASCNLAVLQSGLLKVAWNLDQNSPPTLTQTQLTRPE